VELELSGKLRERAEVRASVALQHAVGGSAEARLANSPHQVSKLSIGVPLWRERLFVSAAARYLSPRMTGTDDLLGGVPLVDCTATARVHPRFDLVTGLRNLLGRRYEDPVYLSVDRLPGDGRSFFVKLVWRVWE
jgi:outer membrane receptor for ferric coprogen and ferric-rhodotorulic acid